jgi:hypothetical protein
MLIKGALADLFFIRCFAFDLREGYETAGRILPATTTFAQ